MPCRDDYGPPDNSAEIDTANAQRERAEKRADRAARVACELEKLLLPTDFTHLSAEAQAWIVEHKERDRKEAAEKARMERLEAERLARKKKDEELRLAALKKLTREERQALGLPHPAHS